MHASPSPPGRGTPDAVFLYSRPGCHLCDDAHAALSALLGERAAAGMPAPPVVVRDITTDPDWEREFLITIPVVQVGAHRLELATSPGRIRALLASALDHGGPDTRPTDRSGANPAAGPPALTSAVETGAEP